MTTTKKKSKKKPVIVIWHDAHSDQHGTWMELGDIDNNPYIVESCGFMLDGAKTGHVTLAQSKSHEGMFDHIIHIPQAMIVRVVHLKDVD